MTCCKSEYSESHGVFGADSSAPHIEVMLLNKTFQLYKSCMQLGENSTKQVSIALPPPECLSLGCSTLQAGQDKGEQNQTPLTTI